ncbi:unnamed protein product [Closterium sp. NIES-64]|nr:unnamed protein product [Closterium sp. NIES-64]
MSAPPPTRGPATYLCGPATYLRARHLPTAPPPTRGPATYLCGPATYLLAPPPTCGPATYQWPRHLPAAAPPTRGPATYLCGPGAYLRPRHLPAAPPPISGPATYLQPRHLPLRPRRLLSAAPLPPPSGPGRRPLSGPAEPPSSRAAQQPSRPAAKPPSSRAAQQLSRPAVEPPTSRAAQQPSSRAAKPPSSRAAEPPSSRAAEPPSSRAAEPPSCRAAESPCSRAARAALVLAFDAEGRAIDFDVWIDDLQLFLQCDRADGLSLFDLTSGASPAPAADADATVRSQWATRDAAARLAVRRHLPTSERAHFSQYKSAQTLYDAVVARYSSPATDALSRLMLPYLFPDLAAFPTVADLVTHLRTSDTRYRAALPADCCAKNPLPMYITLYYIVTPEKSTVAAGSSRGDPHTPVFEGCSPSPLLPSVSSAAAANLVGLESVEAAAAVAVGAEVVEVAEVEEAVAEAEEEEVMALRRGVAPVVVTASSSSAVGRPCPLTSSVSGTLHASGVGVLVRAPTSCALATVRVSSVGVRTPPSAAMAA